jgi:hypothetical protein
MTQDQELKLREFTRYIKRSDTVSGFTAQEARNMHIYKCPANGCLSHRSDYQAGGNFAQRRRPIVEPRDSTAYGWRRSPVCLVLF